jgi:predicted transcriptional regulator
METTVKDIMRTDFAYVKSTDYLSDVISVFVKNPDMAFPVMEADQIIGEIHQGELLKLAITDDDMDTDRILGPRGIREALEKKGVTVSDLMRSETIRISPDTSILNAAKTMVKTGSKTLIVVDKENNRMGYVSELDILLYLQKKLEKLRKMQKQE